MLLKTKSLWFKALLSLLPLLLIGCVSLMEDNRALFSLSGQVLDAEGRGIEGVTLYVGHYGTIVTNEDGAWAKTNLKGAVAVAPAFEESGQPYLFIPSSITVNREAMLRFTGYPQSPMGEEIVFTSREVLAFEGGILIEISHQDLPEDATIMVTEIKELEEILPWDLAPASKIIEIQGNDSIIWEEGVKLRIPIDHTLSSLYGGLYCYDKEKKVWIKEEAAFEHGAFIATINRFSTYGVLKEDIIYKRDATMPYLHQVYATNPNFELDGFNGIHACGPTAAVMILAHFHRLPIEGGSAELGESIYRGYEAYKNTFYREVYDPNTNENHWLGEKRGEGAWGAMYVPGAGACITRAQRYFEDHQLSVEPVGVGEATKSQVIHALEENKLLWASVVGHIVVVKGFVEYSNVKKRLILHDPWGDPRKDREKYYSSSYYRDNEFQKNEGADLLFSWEELMSFYSNPHHGELNLYGLGNMLIVGEYI